MAGRWMLLGALGFLAGACGSGPPDPAGTADTGLSPLGQGLALHGDCSSPPSVVALLDVEAAARTPAPGRDLTIGTLGRDGALELAASLEPTETLCDLRPSAEVAAALAEVDALIAGGRGREAGDHLRALLLDAGSASGVVVLAAGPDFLALALLETDARRITREFMDIAARALLLGFDDVGNDALAKAQDTYERWASDAVERAGWEEALQIGAEAGLLGLADIEQRGIHRAQDIYNPIFEEAIESFNPCAATQENLADWMNEVATGYLLGVPSGNDFRFDNLFESKLELALKVIAARDAGEEVPECGIWSISITVDVGEAPHIVTFQWDGAFALDTDGRVDGEGTGTVVGTAQCVITGGLGDYVGPVVDISGSFTFDVSGSRDVVGGMTSLRLVVAGAEADIEFSEEDPNCGFVNDMASLFLASVPTLPPLYYPAGFEIEMIDDIGRASIPMEPFVLVVEVVRSSP